MKHRSQSHSSGSRMSLRFAAVLLSLVSLLTVTAQDVSINQARGIAADFFATAGVQSTPVRQIPRHKAKPNAVGNSAYYIFNSDAGNAFVIVSGDSRTQPVLAYSTDGAFDTEHMAPAAAYLLDEYERYIKSLQGGINAPVSVTSVDFGSGKIIETALWNQNPSPWWDYCPMYQGSHTYAGCVATAMSIVMRHYQWPAKGYGSKSYTTSTLGLNLSADFEEIDYDWSSLPKGTMSDSGWNTTNKTVIGKLLYQCGVAANMDYNTSGSGANTNSQAVGLYRYFGYTLGDYVAKSTVTDDEWYTYIKDEIDGNNPVLYRGDSDTDGGHAFVCDGYDASGKLHFNFGWSGYNNGYYAIMSTNMNFRNNQGILIGVRPDYDAATREIADFQMRRNTPDSPQGLQIMGEGIVHRGQSFGVRLNNLLNLTDRATEFAVALFICDSDGTRKLKLGEGATNQIYAGGSYAWVSLTAGMPYDYTVTDTDYLVLFSTTDGGTTWKRVECSDPAYGKIHLNDIYDGTASHMKMISIDGQGLGLAVAAGNMANVKGRKFNVSAYCLQNILSSNFTGTVAAFLCDNSGNRKLQIGTSTMSGLPSRSYYYTWNISCAIPKGSDVAVGDKIMIFSKLDGEDTWAGIVCADPDKAYVEITEDILNAEPPQLKMLNIDGRDTGLTLYNNNPVSIGSFTVTCNCPQNLLASEFNGQIAIFLCDAAGKPYYNLGQISLSGLGSGYYYYTLNIGCKITSDMEILEGDRLYAFSRCTGDETWAMVDCAVPECAYIEIPDQILPTQTTIRFANPYATFCSRYDLDLSGLTDIYAYRAIQLNYNTIALERVTKVKAGEGVLLRGINADGGYYTGVADVDNNPAETEENLMVGVLETVVVTQDSPEETKYVLGSYKGEVGFYLANGVTVQRGRAYLAVPGSAISSPGSYSITFPDDGTQGIISVESDADSYEIYNLQGIKVDRPDKGIYIINGKKHIIK